MHSKHTYFNIWRPIHYLHLLIPTLEDPANQGSRMYTQRTVSAPWIESLSEGLSWRRKPFLNQWTVFTTITPLQVPSTVCSMLGCFNRPLSRCLTTHSKEETAFKGVKSDKLSNKVTMYARSNDSGLYSAKKN